MLQLDYLLPSGRHARWECRCWLNQSTTGCWLLSCVLLRNMVTQHIPSNLRCLNLGDKPSPFVHSGVGPLPGHRWPPRPARVAALATADVICPPRARQSLHGGASPGASVSDRGSSDRRGPTQGSTPSARPRPANSFARTQQRQRSRRVPGFIARRGRQGPRAHAALGGGQ